jgi:hypothetical protein
MKYNDIRKFYEFAELLSFTDHKGEERKLIMYPYLKRYIETVHCNQFTVAQKFRQGAFTTATMAYLIWQAHIEPQKYIYFCARTDRSAIEAQRLAARLTEKLGTAAKTNSHLIQFENGGRIAFGTPEGSCGRVIDLFIADEAAFFPDMEKTWQAIHPCISAGNTQFVALSSVNGDSNWFAKIFKEAYENRFTAINGYELKFRHYESSYIEHPDFNTAEWTLNMCKTMGEKGFRSEFCGEFLPKEKERVLSQSVISFLTMLSADESTKLIDVFKTIIK